MPHKFNYFLEKRLNLNVYSSRPAIDDTRIPLAAKPKKATARKDRTDKDQELVLKNRERTEQDELEGISKEVGLFLSELANCNLFY